ncbi:MAG: hypothetical protein IPN73_08990 [Saprospiraceae bacterium]|nr:hypothetical protein [Saprospiraceae bacterium]
MKSELQMLIAELEAEAELLQKELDQCLTDDKNYKAAHRFQKCLGLVNTKLKVLRHLENTNIEKGKELEWKIETLKNLMAELKQQFPTAFSQEMEIKYQNKINALEAYKQEYENKPLPFHMDGEVLYTLLGRLASNEIKKFTLQLEKYDAHIYFSKVNGELRIEVSTAEYYLGPVNLFQNKWNGLAGMGFTPTEEGALLLFPFFDQTMIPSILEILSRLLYDVLGAQGGNTAKIVVG